MLAIRRSAAIIAIAATIFHVALFSLHITSSLGRSLAVAAGPEAAQLALDVHALCGPSRFSETTAVAPEDGQSDRDNDTRRYHCPICLGSAAAACLETASLGLLTKLAFEHAPLQFVVPDSVSRAELLLAPGTIRGPPIV